MFAIMVLLCSVLVPGVLTEGMKWVFISLLALLVLIGAVLFVALLIPHFVWLTPGERKLVATLDNLEAGHVNGVNRHISQPINISQARRRGFFRKLL